MARKKSHHSEGALRLEKGFFYSFNGIRLQQSHHLLPYDVESPGGRAFIGSFLTNKNGLVRHQAGNELSLGRKVYKTLHSVDVLQFAEDLGDVSGRKCQDAVSKTLPPNWATCEWPSLCPVPSFPRKHLT